MPTWKPRVGTGIANCVRVFNMHGLDRFQPPPRHIRVWVEPELRPGSRVHMALRTVVLPPVMPRVLASLGRSARRPPEGLG